MADSLRHAAGGTFPTERHDHTSFAPGSDDVRREMAGKSLGSRFVVLAIEGDWDATTVYLGFPTSADKNNPCTLCCASRETMHDSRVSSVLNCPWVDKSADMHEQTLRDCEITIAIGWEDHRQILSALWYDKGKGSLASRGEH